MFHAFLLLIAPSSAPDSVMLAQLTIEQRVIMRVPMERPARPSPVPPPAREWKEKKGPRCIAVRSIRSGRIARGGIDLTLADGERFRIRLERSCRPMDFYSGFYIEPPRDGSVCTKRDTIRSRNGTVCEIEGFRRLEADR